MDVRLVTGVRDSGGTLGVVRGPVVVTGEPREARNRNVEALVKT